MMLPFAVYDQPAHPYDVNEDYDDFKLFLGFQTCDLSFFCCEINTMWAVGIDYAPFAV